LLRFRRVLSLTIQPLCKILVSLFHFAVCGPNFQMTRLVVVLTTCMAFVHSLNDFLVQGRSDTLRVLRKIIRERDAKPTNFRIPRDPFANSQMAWEAIVPRDVATRNFHSAVEVERSKRDISNAVIESGHCEHIDLMDCSDFETDEMTCMLTATGMTCCVCTGTLRAAKWSLF
uniref:Transposable element Tc3 transposase n=1 Tax=Heligmosomoides polygyrus TaxID=6339 RepID=A0A183FFQ9_HELPZ